MRTNALKRWWPSVAKRASSAAVRWRWCAMAVACSATKARSRPMSASRASREGVATGSSVMLPNYSHRSMVGDGSGIATTEPR